MGMETTITEQDMDTVSQQFVQGFRQDGNEFEPDLAVDGLTESIVSRLIRILRFQKS